MSLDPLPHLPLKPVMSSHKWFLADFSKNAAKSLFYNKICNTEFAIKKGINFWCKTSSFPKKMVKCASRTVFCSFLMCTAFSEKLLNRRNSVAGGWVTSDCVFQHSATVNRKRLYSSLREQLQNDKILPNSSNYLFKRAIQLLRLATRYQILNSFKVNRWLLRLRNSFAVTGSCTFTRATASLAFFQRWNCGNSVARVNGP